MSSPTIKELLYSLVSVQSDTGTKREVEMASHIYSIIKQNKYFQNNPHLCGCFENGDILSRPVIWALKLSNKKTQKTLILNGHYDAAEIDSYGALKPLALKPDELKEALKKLELTEVIHKDLNDGDWCFGRATADMKAGIAINLGALFSEAERDINILFISVYDEETNSLGMQAAVKLLLKLKEQHCLDYKLLVLTEPHVRNDDKKFLVFNGTVGKLLPCIVAKGKLSHAGLIMGGLNSSLMMADVIKSIELNTELCSKDLGVLTLPPTILYAKDSKHSYDVSIPEYSSVYFNLFSLKNASKALLDKVKRLCVSAFQSTIQKYDMAFSELEAMRSKPTNNLKPQYTPKVYYFNEIEEICHKETPEYHLAKSALYAELDKQIRQGLITMQNAGIEVIKNAIRLSKITDPIIVIGLLPPYMPATNNVYLAGYDNNNTMGAIAEVLNNDGVLFEEVAYFMGLSDNSYTSCTNLEEEKNILTNMISFKQFYNIEFDNIAELSVPSIILGPWGKDYHTIAERVYMPDVEKTVPLILENIIKTV